MAIKFEEDNPIKTIILNSILEFGDDLSSENIDTIMNSCAMFLKHALGGDDDILKYLNFEIYVDDENDLVKVSCNNTITGCWFSGIFPPQVDEVVKSNRLVIKTGYYEIDENGQLNFYKNEGTK